MKPLRFVSVAAVLCVLGTLASGQVSAQPEPGPGSAATPVVGWRQLGQSDKIVLLGANQPTEVEIPLPLGVTPLTLIGQIGSMVNVVSGRVDVLDSRGTVVGVIPAPNDPVTVPFSVDTSAAAITDGIAKLSFVLRDANPSPTSCSQTPSVTLTQLATTLSGPAPAPTTVADFRPGYLSRIVIRVGPQPNRDVQQAALTLVARLSSQYRPLRVRIDVDTAAGPRPAVPADTRVIEVKLGRQADMTVRDPGTPAAALVITGTGQLLLNQIALFTDKRINLAQTPSATVASVTETVDASTRTLTFDQLGMTSKTSVLGTTTLYTGFDAAAFHAGPIEGARVHLIARYTPVGSGEGSVLLRSGQTVLATRTLDSSGLLDLAADIPAEEITSNTGLAIDLKYLPRQECAPLTDRLTFALDGASTVSVTTGTGNRRGFAALPMALTPDFSVALGDGDLIRYAAQAINLMGLNATSPLRPVVRAFDEAIRSGAPLLVVADGDQLAKSGLALPLAPGAGNAVTVNGQPITAIDLNGPVGAIQAFTESEGRAVLAVGATTDWTLVDGGFDYIRGLDDNWASLSGDVVATGARNVAVNLTVREGAPMVKRPAPAAAWRWWAWVTVGVGALAAVAIVAILFIRRRRRERV